jgi:putative FmdB family regulatory protein
LIYVYRCDGCNNEFDIIKSVKDFDRIENCPTSGTIMTRAVAPAKLHIYNTQVQESYFHPGLGQVVKGDNHARRIAKERGLIEVGNERPEKHLKVKLSSYDD